MEHTAGYGTELPVATMLVKPYQLVFRDCNAFRHHNQKLDWGCKPVSAGRAVDMPIYIALDDTDRRDILDHASGFPVHHFGQYVCPLILLPCVHADFRWKTWAGRAGLPVPLQGWLHSRSTRLLGRRRRHSVLRGINHHLDNPLADRGGLELNKLVSREIEALALLPNLLNDEIVARSEERRVGKECRYR